MNFRRNIDNFQYFGDFSDFSANRLSIGNIISRPTDNRYFDQKTEILFLVYIASGNNEPFFFK